MLQACNRGVALRSVVPPRRRRGGTLGLRAARLPPRRLSPWAMPWTLTDACPLVCVCAPCHCAVDQVVPVSHDEEALLEIAEKPDAAGARASAKDLPHVRGERGVVGRGNGRAKRHLNLRSYFVALACALANHSTDQLRTRPPAGTRLNQAARRKAPVSPPLFFPPALIRCLGAKCREHVPRCTLADLFSSAALAAYRHRACCTRARVLRVHRCNRGRVHGRFRVCARAVQAERRQ